MTDESGHCVDDIECPQCGGSNVRPRITSSGVGIVDCGDCFASTNSLYGDVEVVGEGSER